MPPSTVRRRGLIAVSGAAGVGKSRLRWELLDYLMTLPDRFLWHPGRCLPYGDGVAYWALAEMVRHRLGIPEDAQVEETEQKLRAGLERWVGDPGEREFVSARLGVLLGVAEGGPGREELFAGWRLFFERMAELDPVVMVFEDMHSADDGLLDFVEYLLDWSAHHRIFILTLARPELSERRPGWAARHRGATAMSLEPLGDAAMEKLIDDVATLPLIAKRRIISHAEGVPLYAIETVRALADRGVLVERDGALVLAGELGELDVPPSLISLLGARLDALGSDERELVRSVSVFGGQFPARRGAGSVGHGPARRRVRSSPRLVRKQVLTVRADPHSPDRGQYRFSQMLLRTVAYETLSKRERKSRHLAAAHYLSHAFANEGEDVAEVLAAHYLQAYRAAADDSDATQLRTEAIAALRRGAQRAAAVGAPQTAERAYRTAIDLAATEDERIDLLKAAGEMALVDGRYEASLGAVRGCRGEARALGREREAARLASKIGHALRRVGRTAEAIDRMSGASGVAERDADRDAAQINVELGVALLAAGRPREAVEPLERALDLAQALELPDVLAGALTFKAQLCVALGRSREARILFDGAIELCRQYELTDRLVIVQLNSGDFLRRFDLPGAAERTSDALANARRAGSRIYESMAASNLMRVWEYTGAWGDARAARRRDARGRSRAAGRRVHPSRTGLARRLPRGRASGRAEHLGGMSPWRHSEANEPAGRTPLARPRSRSPPVTPLRRSNCLSGTMGNIIAAEGVSSQASRIGFPTAIEAAVALGEVDQATALLRLLTEVPPGHVPPFLRAERARGKLWSPRSWATPSRPGLASAPRSRS